MAKKHNLRIIKTSIAAIATIVIILLLTVAINKQVSQRIVYFGSDHILVYYPEFWEGQVVTIKVINLNMSDTYRLDFTDESRYLTDTLGLVMPSFIASNPGYHIIELYKRNNESIFYLIDSLQILVRRC